MGDAAHALFWSTLDDTHRARAEAICAAYGGGDFDEGCLGFLKTYVALALLIPEDRVIYDIGCANAFQSWFFRNHKGYVGIDGACPLEARFQPPNATHVMLDVASWIVTLHPGYFALQPDPHFAIHNACPGGRAVVVAAFQDVYTYYPQSRSDAWCIPGWKHPTG